MKQSNYGELIFSENDVCDQLMQGRDVDSLKGMLVDATVDLEKAALLLDCVPGFITYDALANDDLTIEEFDRRRQTTWHMPDQYKDMDIAQYVLSLCTTEAELQRCGHELLLYQERDLFDLLKFLKYLVDTMHQHHVIWGVGRGSSVASYVLYKLGVHRIDSMFYELAVEEFLR
ncbi:Bacterial DNA polymerase III, alpha subunit [uncultured Caudovirales phage]|uniref:Bacterial DNA polymerase III, alpha subunit n=1 Tax=uncultured Caudovirales phage TaxID=2100421 RepID=A0A6J5LU64_9CAUD|nr:Bacterial DNA polymerase III, alpha subunit [uncultured Caudovirales phage]